MCLAPRSLFGRLVLVLLAGLAAAQLLGAAINRAETADLLERATGMQSARRIAEVARLLDPLGPEERRRIVAILDVPPQIVTLERAPVAEASDTDTHAALYTRVLRSALGDEREVRVTVRDGPDPGALERRRGRMMRGGPPGGGPMMMMMPPGRYFLTQVRLADGEWLRFDTRLADEAASLHWRLALSLAAVVAVVLAVSILAVRWITRPLKTLADAAEGLGRDIHRPALREEGPVEVREAARAFNRMQARLAGFIDERTRVLTAMSHDLKTPITRMRLRADLLDDAAVRAQFEKDLAEMQSMVGDSLAFLRGIDAAEERRPVDVTALLESLQADQAAMGRDVRLEGRAQAPLTAAPRHLRRCLANLIDNAVVYGGRADIGIDDTPRELVIRVRDAGPGIPQSELDKVFEPFYRLEPSRSRETGGTGLGLAIARNIARAHGGDIVLSNLAEGGLEARLTIPHDSDP